VDLLAAAVCETKARDDHGDPRAQPFAAGDIPNVQPDRKCTFGCWVNPGQVVLTNGKVAGAEALPVQAGQGVRLRLLAATTFRYLRLRLTDSTGQQIPLYRVGGEGGLIDQARLEGGSADGFNTKYEAGEILLAPADRADVVFAVPAGTTGALTLSTLDFKQLGAAGVGTPTVPVMRFQVGGATAQPFTMAAGDPIRTHPAVDDPVGDTQLWQDLDLLLDPAGFAPPRPGTTNPRISLMTANGLPAIDGVNAEHDHVGIEYTDTPFETSTRYARVGDELELAVTNTDGMHHPFHQHGFSFQPIALEAEKDPGTVLHRFSYREFVDNVDIPPHTTLRLRLRLEDRPLADGTTGGGATGRWMFHCHIFHHASLGMMGELAVVGQDDSLPPAITADEPFSRIQPDESATNHGTYRDPDDDPVTLSANVGEVTDQGDGRWSWTFAGAVAEDDSRTVVITATDANGTKGQVAFDLADDQAGPVTTLATNPAAPDGANGWFKRSSVAVTLTADDGQGGSGVDRTEYRVDGGAFRDYAGPFDVATPGAHQVEYRSIDRKGNVGEAKTATIKIDAGAPTTTHTLDPASPDAPLGLFYLSAVTVKLAAGDGPDGSGVTLTEYRIDDGDWQKYEAPFTVTGIGMRTVTYRSRDTAGNAEADKTVSWTQLALG
jgi:FtsP/CotA-like multicopper oxidase with cupredoxin domain